METISRHRFRILTLVREPLADAFATEISWFRDPSEIVIGAVFIDTSDNDFGYILLGRDERGQFRWIDGNSSLATQEAAEQALNRAMSETIAAGAVVFPQGDERQRKYERLMTPVYGPDRLNSSFRALASEPGYSPASQLISEIAYSFTDPDGNFVEQFQTAGFDARLWELYLFVMLHEEGCRFDRTMHAPDFNCDHFGLRFACEVVTVNPSQAGADPEPPADADQLRDYNWNFTPIRFGSALLAKLRRRYWNLPHVAGRPLVFAIHDFHQTRSMIWSHSGLPIYLYGRRFEPELNEEGQLKIRSIPVERHVWGNRSLRSGFFSEPESQNVSAVLFSNSATISKFNRLGKLAGFGDHQIVMIRSGEYIDLDPNAVRGIPFRRPVDDEYEETWAEGLSVFHNPHARFPLPMGHFPNFHHHHLREGLIETFHNGGFHPIWSVTEILQRRDEQ